MSFLGGGDGHEAYEFGGQEQSLEGHEERVYYDDTAEQEAEAARDAEADRMFDEFAQGDIDEINAGFLRGAADNEQLIAEEQRMFDAQWQRHLDEGVAAVAAEEEEAFVDAARIAEHRHLGVSNPRAVQDYEAYNPLDLNIHPGIGPIPRPYYPRDRDPYVTLGSLEFSDMAEGNPPPLIISVGQWIANARSRVTDASQDPPLYEFYRPFETHISFFVSSTYRKCFLSALAAFGWHQHHRHEPSSSMHQTHDTPDFRRIMVRVSIENLEVYQDLPTGRVYTFKDLNSDNTYANLADHNGTILRLVKKLRHKYYDGHGDFALPHGNSGGSFFIAQKKAQIFRVKYQFDFVLRPGAPPLTVDYAQRQRAVGILIRLSHRDLTLIYNPEGPEVRENPQAEQNEEEEENLGGGDPHNGFDGPRPRPRPQPPFRSPVMTRSRTQLASTAAARGNHIGIAANVRQNPRNRRPSLKIRESSMRIGATSYEDVINDLSRQIYIKKSLGNIFSYTKAMIGVPETDVELCFPMAFMRAQLRIWGYQKSTSTYTTEVTRITEDEVVTLPVFSLPSDPFPDYIRNSDTSFFNLAEDNESGTIRIFDNTKKKLPKNTPALGPNTNFNLYVNELKSTSQADLDVWAWCAWQLHLYVEDIWGEKIDVNDLDTCLKTYSYVFEVNISVFVMEEKGMRAIIQPVLYNDTERPDSEKHIALILHGSHLHAISNIRHYHRSEIHSKSMSICVYCDRCGTIAYNRKLTHHKKCAEVKDWHLMPTLETIHEDQATKVTERKMISYFKKGSEQDTAMYCRGCKKTVSTTNCECPPSLITKVQFVKCEVCGDSVPRNHYNNHQCFMNSKKVLPPLENNKIFVYDIESIQDQDPTTLKYVHECVLVCLKAVYDDRKWSFKSIETFVSFLLDNSFMHGSTILAHNGGGYDHQFVLAYLEENGVMHSVIPRPNTIHKYLLLTIKMTGPKTAIRFLDFMMMMTSSLKDIGTAFKLPVCKGDFPHRFSSKKHLDYCGPIPPLDSPEDYYGFKQVKSEQGLAETRAFWVGQTLKYCTCPNNLLCTCDKLKWDFRKELEEYCWLDVEVLGEACKAYRDQTMGFSGDQEYDWSMKGLDPFQYMTQSQIALAIFTQGKVKRDLAITHERKRAKFKAEQILWLEYLMTTNSRYKITHAGNSFKEHFSVDDQCFVEGYCPNTRTVFLYRDCFHEACPVCYEKEIAEKSLHPTRKIGWNVIRDVNNKKFLSLRHNNVYHDVIVHWSHNNSLFKNYSDQQDARRWDLMGLRDIFYGGRTECFSSYATPSEDEKIEYDDVCSLYPYVCAHKDLPIGYPEIIFNAEDIDNNRFYSSHPDPYFGFARVRILPNDKDFIGILPSREDDRLKYTLHEKEGCWSIEFIKLALERGYKLLKVYEVWHWGPLTRSNTAMRGYMQYFLRMKQAAEGWVKMGQDLYSEAELADGVRTAEMENAICDYIYKQNGDMARPIPTHVEKNPVKRQLAKIFLNCLWGKLCQKTPGEYERSIYGYKQYSEFMNNSSIDEASVKFRFVNGGVYKARYSLNSTAYAKEGSYINLPMAATVTAHAQIILMRQMFVVGPERMLYCDTDSIIYLKRKDGEVYTRSGLGNWADEYPGKVITKFLALAPKSYVLEIEDEAMLFKCKGVRVTEENRRRTTVPHLQEIVQTAFIPGSGKSKIIAETMVIGPNSTNSSLPYGALCTTYGSKKVQVVYSKRVLTINKNPFVISLQQMKIIRLVPEGYQGELGHEEIPVPEEVRRRFKEADLVEHGYVNTEEEEGGVSMEDMEIA